MWLVFNSPENCKPVISTVNISGVIWCHNRVGTRIFQGYCAPTASGGHLIICVNPSMLPGLFAEPAPLWKHRRRKVPSVFYFLFSSECLFDAKPNLNQAFLSNKVSPALNPVVLPFPHGYSVFEKTPLWKHLCFSERLSAVDPIWQSYLSSSYENKSIP